MGNINGNINTVPMCIQSTRAPGAWSTWLTEILGLPGADCRSWEMCRSPTGGNLPRYNRLPSGKHTKNYGKSQFSMGKSAIHGHVQ